MQLAWPDALARCQRAGTRYSARWYQIFGKFSPSRTTLTSRTTSARDLVESVADQPPNRPTALRSILDEARFSRGILEPLGVASIPTAAAA